MRSLALMRIMNYEPVLNNLHFHTSTMIQTETVIISTTNNDEECLSVSSSDAYIFFKNRQFED